MKKLIILLYIILLPSVVHATVIFNNELNSTYVLGSPAWVESWPSASETFIAGITANLTEIKIPIFALQANPPFDLFNLTLSDAKSNILEQWTNLEAPYLNYNVLALVDVVSVAKPLLIATNVYTLTANNANADTVAAWEIQNNLIDPSLAGVEVLGTVANSVPEPTTIALLATGLLGFAAKRRKNNQA